jgi:hypothetical protein
MLARLASVRPGEQQVHLCREDLQRTGYTDRPSEAARAQPLAEWSAFAVSGIADCLAAVAIVLSLPFVLPLE